jgi:acetoin utilization deacetylase AcuC-like enzyme
VREIGKGEGLGYAVNVPMLPGADDKVFLEGFFAVVPRLLRHFDPDVIVSQLGLDTFWNDPLAALEFTTNGYCRVISTPAKAGGEIFFSVIKDFSVTSFLRNDAAISATKY